MRTPRTNPVRTLVADILDTVPAARSSDRELIYRLLLRAGFDLPRTRFMRLPNLDYVTRVKREILREREDSTRPRARERSAADRMVRRIARWFGS